MYADKIFINGSIYTENKEMMQAEAVAVKGSSFICVGKNEECMKYRGDNTQVVDLEGKTVIPALIDGHTHPVTVAKTYWHVRMPLTHDREKLLANIREYAAKHPKESCPYFYGESYFAETFGTEGPKKEILDEIISDRPARIQDFTDHACWYNSIALEMLDGKAGSPKGEAEFIKDEAGQYTGCGLLKRDLTPTTEYTGLLTGTLRREQRKNRCHLSLIFSRARVLYALWTALQKMKKASECFMKWTKPADSICFMRAPALWEHMRSLMRPLQEYATGRKNTHQSTFISTQSSSLWTEQTRWVTAQALSR